MFSSPIDTTPLPRSFYERSTLIVAQELLGKILVHRSPEGETLGKIVETEAYLGEADEGSHAFGGRRTPRNSPMFEEAGHAYIYFIYGMYFNFNIVAKPPRLAGGVLIRALEPRGGLELMARRRGVAEERLLTSGPGRLCQAMGLTLEQNRLDITGDVLFVCDGETVASGDIVARRRIGIKTGLDKEWRFYIRGNRFVSKP